MSVTINLHEFIQFHLTYHEQTTLFTIEKQHINDTNGVALADYKHPDRHRVSLSKATCPEITSSCVYVQGSDPCMSSHTGIISSLEPHMHENIIGLMTQKFNSVSIDGSFPNIFAKTQQTIEQLALLTKNNWVCFRFEDIPEVKDKFEQHFKNMKNKYTHN